MWQTKHSTQPSTVINQQEKPVGSYSKFRGYSIQLKCQIDPILNILLGVDTLEIGYLVDFFACSPMYHPLCSSRCMSEECRPDSCVQRGKHVTTD